MPAIGKRSALYQRAQTLTHHVRVLCRASTSRNVSQIKEVHGRDNLGHAAAGRSRMTLFGIMACKIQSRLWVKTGKAQCEHMFSALPLRADIGEQSRHVRFVPTRDIPRSN